VVDRRHRFRQETRVAVRDAEDQAPDAYAFRFGRGGGQCGDGLEAVTIASAVWCLLEMIGDREPIEATLVSEPPKPSQLVERPTEMADVDAEIDAARLIPVGVGGHTTGRRRHRGGRVGGVRGRAFTTRARGGTRGGRQQQRCSHGE